MKNSNEQDARWLVSKLNKTAQDEFQDDFSLLDSSEQAFVLEILLNDELISV